MKKYVSSEKPLEGLLRVCRKPEQDQAFALAVRQALSHIPSQQLPESNQNLLGSEKVLLTRKANEFFRLGQIQAAEKIYLAVGYSAGLHKLAEYYLKKENFIKAYLLFQAANDYQNVNAFDRTFCYCYSQVAEKLDSSNVEFSRLLGIGLVYGKRELGS